MCVAGVFLFLGLMSVDVLLLSLDDYIAFTVCRCVLEVVPQSMDLFRSNMK